MTRNAIRDVLVAACAAALAAGCTDSDDTAATGARSAVARFEIDEGSALSIVGLDGSGAQVGTLFLDHGRFVDDEDGRELEGTRLELTVGAMTIQHHSEGRAKLDLPAPGPDEMQSFLLDPRLTDVLARWNVKVHRSEEPILVDPELATDPEVAYDSGAPCQFTAGGACGSIDCCQVALGGTFYGETRVCNSSNTWAYRRCTTQGQGYETGCGPAGMNGCAVCWSYPRQYGWHYYTFYDGNNCGIGYCDLVNDVSCQQTFPGECANLCEAQGYGTWPQCYNWCID